MRISLLALGFCYLVSGAKAAPNYTDPQQVASREISKLQQSYQQHIKGVLSSNRTDSCTSENLVYRQEWGTLSKADRRRYIKAVQCLRTKPPRSSVVDVPGARTRFDDWAAVHIKATLNVHYSGLFLPWHRHFVRTYERALIEECGYNGVHPYWDWTISWKDPRKSSLFDGSSYSLGGNGKSVAHGPTNISAFGLSLAINPGTGGGCVQSGPFRNHTVHLGPVAFEPKGPDGGLGYNPRCLSRDLSPEWSAHTRPTDVLEALTSCQDIQCFRINLEKIDGVHAAGHFTLGGLGIDAYAGPGDPDFFLHHAGVDRLWTIWQNQNAENRTDQVSDTSTSFNVPPSAPVTLDTTLDFGVLAPPQRLGDLVSTVDGPYCYMYV